MVSLEQFRAALGAKAEHMSEVELRNLMALNERLASVLFNGWRRALQEKKGQVVHVQEMGLQQGESMIQV